MKTYIQSSLDKHGVTISFFGWKQTVISAIDVKINHISTKLITDKGKNTLKLKDQIIT